MIKSTALIRTLEIKFSLILTLDKHFSIINELIIFMRSDTDNEQKVKVISLPDRTT